jgi:hypothetical protein
MRVPSVGVPAVILLMLTLPVKPDHSGERARRAADNLLAAS